jgi:WH2 motif
MLASHWPIADTSLSPKSTLTQTIFYRFANYSNKMPGPPPPPPPMMAPVKKAFVPAAPAGGDMRNALLGQIQKGAKLKKTVTVDKSVPVGAGKIAGEAAAPSPSRSRGPPSATPSNKSSPDNSSSSPVSGSRPPGGFTNIADELQFKLTLKKNKNSPTKEMPKVAPTKEVSDDNIKSFALAFLKIDYQCDGPALASQILTSRSNFSPRLQHRQTRL